MFKRDDDDFPLSSNPEYFVFADHGKKEMKERNARGKGQLLQLKRDLLRNQVNPKASAADEEHVEQKTKEALAAQKKEVPFGTKTFKQEEKDSILSAQSKATTDKAVKEAKQQEARKDVAKEEYQQNMS